MSLIEPQSESIPAVRDAQVFDNVLPITGGFLPDVDQRTFGELHRTFDDDRFILNNRSLKGAHLSTVYARMVMIGMM